MSSDVYTNASLWRRLAALVYDSFLVVAIWMLSTMLMVALLNSGEPVAGPVYQAFLYFESAAFYFYFWRVKGQTLGMQVWKIRTVNEMGEILSLGECATRFFFATFSTAFLGLGFAWILFDRENLAWHDHASGTRVIYLGSEPYETNAAHKETSNPADPDGD
jgi:uncharacterized RDD family membrane protein YckC